jgi:oxygen-independent coproporphyrinogen-3 oxidase
MTPATLGDRAPLRLEPYFARRSDDPLTQAFPRKQPLMPWRSHRALPAEAGRRALEAMRHRTEGLRPRLAYVHVPFCHARCAFCGFFRNRYVPSASAPYVDAVIAEMTREARDARLRARPIRAVYFGGGTPTALEPDDLGRLVRAARELLPLAADCEITLEGRVTYLDDARLDAALDAGVNRISLGVQSFDTDIRRKQGRRAAKDEVLRFLERLVARDRATIVIDLIYGLPGQSDESWTDDLRTCAQLGLDGVDLYTLAVFPGTPLFKAIEDGRMAPPASFAERAQRYRMGVETFDSAGWTQISNSHFARSPRERNQYNHLVKTGSETFAYGSGAGGSLGPLSFANEGCLERYRERNDRGEKPVESVREADALQPARDRVLGELDGGALDLGGLAGASPDRARLSPLLDPLVDQWQSAGLLQRTGDRARLSTAGRFWSNNLASALFELLEATFPEARRDERSAPETSATS